MIEAAGIPTVSISILRAVTEAVHPPRAVFVRWPFGHPFGEPRVPEQQMTIVKEALRALTTIKAPGTIIDLRYPWKRVDYRGLPEAIRFSDEG